MSRSVRRWLVEEIGEREGSTRVLAIIRVGLAIVLLAEWGDALIYIRDQRPVSIVLGISTLVAACFLLAGLWTRVSAIWTALSATAVMWISGYYLGREFFVHHHTAMMVLALWILALSPCGRSYSVDRWLAARRGGPLPPERDAVWQQRLLLVLVSTVYVWGAESKLIPAFLSGARLEQLYILNTGSMLPPSPLFHVLMVAASWGTIALEIFLAVGLWSPRWRLRAIAAGVVFHASIYYLLEVSTFTAMMYVLYLAALDPDDVHRAIDQMSGVPAPALDGVSSERGSSPQ